MSLRVVQASLGDRSYPIEIGTGTLAQAGALVKRLRPVTHAVVITDEHLEATHASAVAESLARKQIATDMIVLEPGEATKCAEAANDLWNKLLELGTDRKTLLVAVGGGVIGDLVGFVAATFARGLDFLQVPTSLLAQVDSSVGGKVGINLPQAKNMVGAFWQPLAVLIDTNVLATLPPRELSAGLAEVVKYGVILDAEFFALLERQAEAIMARDPKVLREVIARCCELKAQVVAADERETTGQRAMLNYGHTFAHAFEALSGYDGILHGEAVAIGMLCASRLAERLGRVDAEFTARQERLLTKLGLPTKPPSLEADQVLKAMSHDKKVEHGRLRFVLPVRMGLVELVANVPDDAVRAALN